MSALAQELANGNVAGSAPTVHGPTVATRVSKRAIDVVLGSILIVVCAPVVLVLAAVLAVQLRGWPFFAHHRVGEGERRLWFPKLRTLPRSTPVYADKTPQLIQPVSRLARFLRRSHLDELPQLLLVPLGQLSLDGPRPMMPHEFEGSDRAWRRERLTVRQGCTGLWQVGHGQSLRVKDSPEFDAAYVRHLTVLLDLWIMWRTWSQFGGGSGVSLDDVPPWLWRAPRPVAPPALAGSDLDS